MKKGFLFIFFLIFVSVTSYEQGKVLPVPLKGQIKSNWCWAACTEMIDHFFGTSPRMQCQIVHSYFQPFSSSPITVDCDTFGCDTNPPAIAPDYNSKLMITNIYHGSSRVLSNLGYYSSIEYFPNSPNWSTIVTEINECRPIILMVAQTPVNNPNINSPNHVMVIYGYKEVGSSKYILVRDPWYPGTNECKCNFTEINFTNITSHTCPIRLSGYQLNICKKSEDFCAPCKPERSPINLVPDSAMMAIRKGEEPINISVKMLSFDLKNNSAFFNGELLDKHYTSTGRTIGYLIKDGKEIELEIKNCTYPNIVNINYKGKPFSVTNNGENNTSKYTVIYSPYPQNIKFYSFKDPITQNDVYFSTKNVYNPLNTKKILFKANETYYEHKFFNKIDCYSNKVGKQLKIEEQWYGGDLSAGKKFLITSK